MSNRHSLRIERKVSDRMHRLMKGLGFKLHPEDAHIAEARLKECLREFVQHDSRNFEVLRMFNILYDSGAPTRLSQKMAVKEALRRGWTISVPATHGNEFEQYVMPESYKLQLLFEHSEDEIFDQFHHQIPPEKFVEMQRLFQRFLDRKRDQAERAVFKYLRKHMNFEVEDDQTKVISVLQKRMLAQVDFAEEDEESAPGTREKDTVSLGSESKVAQESTRNEKTSPPQNVLTRTKQVIAQANARGQVVHHYPFKKTPQKNPFKAQSRPGGVGQMQAKPVPFEVAQRPRKKRIRKPFEAPSEERPDDTQKKELDPGTSEHKDGSTETEGSEESQGEGSGSASEHPEKMSEEKDELKSSSESEQASEQDIEATDQSGEKETSQATGEVSGQSGQLTEEEEASEENKTEQKSPSQEEEQKSVTTEQEEDESVAEQSQDASSDKSDTSQTVVEEESPNSQETSGQSQETTEQSPKQKEESAEEVSESADMTTTSPSQKDEDEGTTDNAGSTQTSETASGKSEEASVQSQEAVDESQKTGSQKSQGSKSGSEGEEVSDQEAKLETASKAQEDQSNASSEQVQSEQVEASQSAESERESEKSQVKSEKNESKSTKTIEPIENSEQDVESEQEAESQPSKAIQEKSEDSAEDQMSRESDEDSEKTSQESAEASETSGETQTSDEEGQEDSDKQGEPDQGAKSQATGEPEKTPKSGESGQEESGGPKKSEVGDQTQREDSPKSGKSGENENELQDGDSSGESMDEADAGEKTETTEKSEKTGETGDLPNQGESQSQASETGSKKSGNQEEASGASPDRDEKTPSEQGETESGEAPSIASGSEEKSGKTKAGQSQLQEDVSGSPESKEEGSGASGRAKEDQRDKLATLNNQLEDVDEEDTDGLLGKKEAQAKNPFDTGEDLKQKEEREKEEQRKKELEQKREKEKRLQREKEIEEEKREAERIEQEKQERIRREREKKEEEERIRREREKKAEEERIRREREKKAEEERIQREKEKKEKKEQIRKEKEKKAEEERIQREKEEAERKRQERVKEMERRKKELEKKEREREELKKKKKEEQIKKNKEAMAKKKQEREKKRKEQEEAKQKKAAAAAKTGKGGPISLANRGKEKTTEGRSSANRRKGDRQGGEQHRQGIQRDCEHEHRRLPASEADVRHPLRAAVPEGHASASAGNQPVYQGAEGDADERGQHHQNLHQNQGPEEPDLADFGHQDRVLLLEPAEALRDAAGLERTNQNHEQQNRNRCPHFCQNPEQRRSHFGVGGALHREELPDHRGHDGHQQAQHGAAVESTALREVLGRDDSAARNVPRAGLQCGHLQQIVDRPEEHQEPEESPHAAVALHVLEQNGRDSREQPASGQRALERGVRAQRPDDPDRAHRHGAVDLHARVHRVRVAAGRNQGVPGEPPVQLHRQRDQRLQKLLQLPVPAEHRKVDLQQFLLEQGENEDQERLRLDVHVQGQVRHQEARQRLLRARRRQARVLYFAFQPEVRRVDENLRSKGTQLEMLRGGRE